MLAGGFGNIKIYAIVIIINLSTFVASNQPYPIKQGINPIKQGINPRTTNITSNTTTSSQYFFVPSGSFLQFSLNNW
jgi:hypothetical protein